MIFGCAERENSPHFVCKSGVSSEDKWWFMANDRCFTIKIQAICLPSLDSIGSIDAYVSIENNENDKVARTKPVNNNVNPKWAEVRVPVNRLTFALDRAEAEELKVIFSVYNYNIMKANQYVGSVCIDVRELYHLEQIATPKAWVLDDQENPNCMLSKSHLSINV